MGFLGLARGPETFRLLDWWAKRLVDHCRADLEQGFFVDQKWMDLAPALFNGVEILRSGGVNVAHWNLHERNWDGRALPRLFHFSGFIPVIRIWFLAIRIVIVKKT